MSDRIIDKRITVIVGGGASGMMAAIKSAQKGNQVILVEKNEKLGKKIYITGKGRCNLTNDIEVEDFFPNVVRNSAFLRSALYEFSPQKTMEFFSDNGLKIKTERGNRVFPLSDKASDVTACLHNLLKKYKVKILLNSVVKNIVVENNSVSKITLLNLLDNSVNEILCSSVIIATGGISYPTTGSTGDGYKFAKDFGHTITELKPSLVGLDLNDSDIKTLQGLSLKNVVLSVFNDKKLIFSELGEALFTHFGISGPLVLSCSALINRQNLKNLSLVIDFKPALSETMLEARLIREFKDNNRKNLFSVIRALLPVSMADVFIKRLKIDKNKNCSEITKFERNSIINLLKNFPLSIKGIRPIEEAIITSGGVSVKEINPKTMESKIVKNLFFAGEVIDVDCLTGGFNLQVAFSTGYIAGSNS